MKTISFIFCLLGILGTQTIAAEDELVGMKCSVPAICTSPTSEYTSTAWMPAYTSTSDCTDTAKIKGDIGPVGPKGEIGPIGSMGKVGPRGLKGAVGPKGGVGAVGPKGKIGDVGPKGDVGQKGETGRVDNSSIGLIQNELEATTGTKIQACEAKSAELEKKIQSLMPHDCATVTRDIAKARNGTGGIFDLFHDEIGYIEVYCDTITDGGRWLVFQRRQNGLVNFYRNWTDYVEGFGEKSGEFWLGLETLHRLTQHGDYELRIDLEDWEGNRTFAEYSIFRIGDGESTYQLNVSGYSGDAGDSLSIANGMKFSTKNRDSDNSSRNCAVLYEGAWWYKDCHQSNLNGHYFNGGHHTSHGVEWESWKGHYYSLKFTEMKVRKL